jgi:hypothetical protein
VLAGRSVGACLPLRPPITDHRLERAVVRAAVPARVRLTLVPEFAMVIIKIQLSIIKKKSTTRVCTAHY